MAYRYWRWLVVAVMLTVAGCSRDDECPPSEVNELARIALASIVDVDRVAEPSDARLYIDGSGSMAGFAGDHGEAGRPFGDVIGSLGDWLGARHFRVHRVNDASVDEIGEATLEQVRAMQAPDFYLCAGPLIGPNCSNQHSPTPLALEQIAQAPDNSVSIFISDLWFSAPQILASPGIQMRGSLRRILKNRDILVYGFQAPYGATLSDLPSRARDVRPARLPFYMIVAGPPDQLRAFHARVLRTGSDWFTERVDQTARDSASPTSGEFRFALFTDRSLFDSGLATAVAIDPSDPAHRGVNEGYPWREMNNAIPKQFRIDTARLPDRPAPIIWSPQRQLVAAAVAGGEYVIEVTARQVIDRSTCQLSTTPRVLVRASTIGPVALQTRELSRTLGRGQWLIAGRARRTRSDPRDPQIAWMRDEWSFPATRAGEDMARARGDFFPTQSLATFAQLLQLSVDDAIREAEPSPLIGMTTVVEIE